MVLAARAGCNIQEACTVLAMVTTKSVILETERLILRQFVPGDADALSRVLSDPETMRHYPGVRQGRGGGVASTQSPAI